MDGTNLEGAKLINAVITGAGEGGPQAALHASVCTRTKTISSHVLPSTHGGPPVQSDALPTGTTFEGANLKDADFEDALIGRWGCWARLRGDWCCSP